MSGGCTDCRRMLSFGCPGCGPLPSDCVKPRACNYSILRGSGDFERVVSSVISKVTL